MGVRANAQSTSVGGTLTRAGHGLNAAARAKHLRGKRRRGPAEGPGGERPSGCGAKRAAVYGGPDRSWMPSGSADEAAAGSPSATRRNRGRYQGEPARGPTVDGGEIEQLTFDEQEPSVDERMTAALANAFVHARRSVVAGTAPDRHAEIGDHGSGVAARIAASQLLPQLTSTAGAGAGGVARSGWRIVKRVERGRGVGARRLGNAGRLALPSRRGSAEGEGEPSMLRDPWPGRLLVGVANAAGRTCCAWQQAAGRQRMGRYRMGRHRRCVPAEGSS